MEYFRSANVFEKAASAMFALRFRRGDHLRIELPGMVMAGESRMLSLNGLQ